MKFKLILFAILGITLLSGYGGGASSSTSAEKNGMNNDVELIELNTFNLENKVVTLNNGVKMPVLGIGTYALKIYGNENGVGRRRSRTYSRII